VRLYPIHLLRFANGRSVYHTSDTAFHPLVLAAASLWPNVVDRVGLVRAVGALEVVALKHGPVVVRLRTKDRAEGAPLPSLTPVWRSAEFQEREIYDLYGIHFEGHPDLRRILMWDEFTDFPMRKDYREPDDYEYEPTPHDDVLEKAKQHYAPRPRLDGAEGVTAAPS